MFASYYAARETELLLKQLAIAQSAVLAADAGYAQGKNSSGTALAARAAVAQAQDQIDAANSRLRLARIALSRWIGDAAERPQQNRPDIDVLPLHAHQDTAQLETQLREHPDIVLLDRRIDAARLDADLARAERKSDWSIELSYARRGPLYTDMVSLGVSVPLQLNHRNRQDRQLASSLAMAAATKAEREEMYREHIAEIRSMLDAWHTARERLSRYRADLMPLSQDRIVAAEAAYRGGKLSLSDVIDARRDQIAIELQALQLEGDIANLWSKLSFLTIDRDARIQGADHE